MKFNKKLIFVGLISLILFSLSCKDDGRVIYKIKIKEDANKVVPKNIGLSVMTLDSTKFVVGKPVEIKMIIADSSTIDSVILFINEKNINTFKGSEFNYLWQTSDTKVGSNKIRVNIYWGENNQRKEDLAFFLSDVEPQNLTYEVIKTYNHDKGAYTQGLFFNEGVLYEATGLKGESSIRKTNLENGDVLKSYSISSDIFGEGITLFDGKIIQLSWQAHKGFVYDKKTFEKVAEFNYPTEGWGLTNNETELIMSDGTNTIYFLETQSHSVIKQIEVCDNKGKVTELNELEYINGEIYANIYMTNKIAKIDPQTGKVLAYIDLTGILEQKYRDRETDVLNGIAYDAENDRLFVTGKKWAKLFEIKVK